MLATALKVAPMDRLRPACEVLQCRPDKAGGRPHALQLAYVLTDMLMLMSIASLNLTRA